MVKRSIAEIFIDFEGNKDKTPTFLGVLERTADHEIFHQYILEDAFAVLAPSNQHHQLRVASLEAILEDIDVRYGQNSVIYAWSYREQAAIDELLEGSELSRQWINRITDAKKMAKRWVRAAFPNHEFRKTEFRGSHTLDQYLELIGYKVPTVHGAGKTGTRLRSLRKTLTNGQPFETWPPSKKKYWTNLLAHNRHDCYGMMAIVDRVLTDADQQV